MSIVILRRRKLGLTSCKSIKKYAIGNIDVLRNDRITGEEEIDLLIRWGCTSQIPSKRTLNKAEAISLTNNKLASRKLFVDKGVSTPRLYTDDEDISYPVVVRPTNHSQGKMFFLCNNEDELERAIDRIHFLDKDFYISEYINKDREFGVFVFNDRVTSVIEKVPKTEEAKKAHAWNVAQGTHRFENVKWTDWNVKACKLALQAVKVLGLDFGRVDIITDSEDNAYVLEVNSAHSLTSEYRQKVFAKCLDYYISNGPVQNELVFKSINSFKGLIHPALRPNKKGYNL